MIFKYTHEKMFKAPFINGELQVKTTMRYYYIALKMPQLKLTIVDNRIWSNWNSHAFLCKMVKTPLKNTNSTSYADTNHMLQQSTPRQLSKRNESIHPQKEIHMDVRISFTWNSPKLQILNFFFFLKTESCSVTQAGV